MHVRLRKLLPLILLCIIPLSAAAEEDIFELELQSLMQIQVTTAGRKAQQLMNVPAAIYVIEAEDLQNSGATSIPEALRMVPGMQVSRISSSKWAIASRGFNGTFSNKLLVQIDGRSVYNPAYSGVYWDVQNVMLEDVERIEVIRGPGATLWGANAVNGIINIITRAASETLGGLVRIGSGNHEKQLLGFRYGAQLNQDIYGRVYLQHKERDEFRYFNDSSPARDDWEMSYGGFRLDGDKGIDSSWTLQGDLYAGQERQQIIPYYTETATLRLNDEVDASGYNFLGRWTHRVSDTSEWTLQSYYDVTDREEGYLAQIHRTFDIDFQHRFHPADRHDIVWGLGFRNVSDDFDNSYMISFEPDHASKQTYSAFIQDEISLIPNRLWLTLGSKLEKNDFTGTEIQPSARILFRPSTNQSIWAAVSKAVRTPSRVEHGGQIAASRTDLSALASIAPVPESITAFAQGNPDKPAEEVISYELGYRSAWAEQLTLDVTAFYNDYKDLTDFPSSSELDLSVYGIDETIPQAFTFIGSMVGHSRGMEVSLLWEPSRWFNSELNYSYIRLSMDAQSSNSIDTTTEESSPRHQLLLKTGFVPLDSLRLNLWARYIDTLPTSSSVASRIGVSVPDYWAADANLIWDIRDDMQLSIVGHNLFDSGHLEFINEQFTLPIEIERSAYASLKWSF